MFKWNMIFNEKHKIGGTWFYPSITDWIMKSLRGGVENEGFLLTSTEKESQFRGGASYYVWIKIIKTDILFFRITCTNK